MLDPNAPSVATKWFNDACAYSFGNDRRGSLPCRTSSWFAPVFAHYQHHGWINTRAVATIEEETSIEELEGVLALARNDGELAQRFARFVQENLCESKAAPTAVKEPNVWKNAFIFHYIPRNPACRQRSTPVDRFVSYDLSLDRYILHTHRSTAL